MLGEYDITATLPVKDLAAAKTFYSDTLGLMLETENEWFLLYKSGNTRVLVYPSEYAGTNKGTAAGWQVKDLENVVEQLKAKGVTFEHYDMPGAERRGDVHVMGDTKSAWFTDPSGNILALDDGMGD